MSWDIRQKLTAVIVAFFKVGSEVIVAFFKVSSAVIVALFKVGSGVIVAFFKDGSSVIRHVVSSWFKNWGSIWCELRVSSEINSSNCHVIQSWFKSNVTLFKVGSRIEKVFGKKWGIRQKVTVAFVKNVTEEHDTKEVFCELCCLRDSLEVTAVILNLYKV